MERFIIAPDVTAVSGVTVKKETILDYEKNGIKQRVENLVLTTKAYQKTDEYESTSTVKVFLNEGDVLLFEDGGRGYIKPLNQFVTIADAISLLHDVEEAIKEDNNVSD